MFEGLYVHVPFCRRRCDYCHFFVVRDGASKHDVYMRALREELGGVSDCFQTVYFGGGTPSLLGGEKIGEILGWIDRAEGAEVTLEANPDGMGKKELESFLEAGVNRLSIGVQSLDNKMLKSIGRTHSGEQAVGVVEAAKAVGFKNISVDLMLDLPGQTVEMVERTVEGLVGLGVQHVSLYNLVIEEPSLFARRRDEIARQMPADDASLKMLEMVVQGLADAGFKRYEISAFATDKQFESRHNKGYWLGKSFLGVGPSAFSYADGRRWRNPLSMQKWVEKPGEADFEERLSKEAHENELLAIALRLKDGVESEWWDEKLAEAGLIRREGSRVQLTERGMLFYDTVASEIVSLPT